MRSRPAMTDVAELAGVSHQTVSRVLNKHPHVTEKTRLRVQAAINQLGYRPNRAAKALVTGRTQTFGVVARTSLLYGPVSLLASFEQAAAGENYTVAVASVSAFDRESLNRAVERLLALNVAGIVLIAPVAAADEALASIPDAIPVVTVDGDPGRSMATVTIDQAEGARLATQHLLDAGHPTVWHLCGPDGWFDSAGRIAGWERTLRAAGITPPPLVKGDWSAASGYRAGAVLARIPDATAVFTANDHQALGLLCALHEHGRRVPDDVSVVGFDDVPEAGYFIPPLTTIRPDFDTVGQRTLALLLDALAGSSAAPPVVLPPTLVERASVAPPR